MLSPQVAQAWCSEDRRDDDRGTDGSGAQSLALCPTSDQLSQACGDASLSEQACIPCVSHLFEGCPESGRMTSDATHKFCEAVVLAMCRRVIQTLLTIFYIDDIYNHE
jgi:hypothetical protein